MNTDHREIERKFRLRSTRLDSVYEQIAALPYVNMTYGLEACETVDYYWRPPVDSSIQIVRLRDSWGRGSDGFSRSLKESTIKGKDKGDNFNRLEINELITDCALVYKRNSLLYGPPLGKLYKDERVIFTQDGMVISLSRVNNEPFMYMEVEGPDENKVEMYCKFLKDIFQLEPEPRSLFEIYILGSGEKNNDHPRKEAIA